MNFSRFLSDQHLNQLREESGISDDVIEERGYETLTKKSQAADRGFTPVQQSVPGLLMPIHRINGTGIATYQLRPDNPRVKEGKTIKYEFPGGSRMAIDVHPRIRQEVRDPSKPLFITEGVKKADAAISHGLICIALLGVWNFAGTNEFGSKTTLPEWNEIAIDGRDIYIVFDSDVMIKPGVFSALERFSAIVKRWGGRVHYIYLPHGKDGAKTGLDDFFVAGNTTNDLMRYVSSELRKPPEELRDETSTDYEFRPDGIVYNRRTPDGIVPAYLCNFTAQIVADTLEDDGTEVRRVFTIKATLNGKESTFDVTPAQFAAMHWPLERLGSGAYTHPGRNIAEHIRAAIQKHSDAEVRHVLTHTGWTEHDGQSTYCHSGSPAVSLAGPLAGYCLPEPSPMGSQQLKEEVGALIRLWKTGKAEVVFPAVVSVFRAVLCPCDFYIFLSGRTGAFKTQLALLALSHFTGNGDAKNLMLDWSSTANYLEGAAFSAKDAVLVIDEYVPSGSVADRQRQEEKASTVLRGAGNNAARGRMRSDGTLRPSKPPRGLILSTGEETPKGQSLRARGFIIEVAPGDLPKDALTLCQKDAANGLYARALAGFIKWLEPRYRETLGAMRDSVIAYREKASAHIEAHRRTPEIVANLGIGFELFLRYGVEAGALSEEEAKGLKQWGGRVLMSVGAQQSGIQNETNPTTRFLELLAQSLSSGRCHVATLKGDEPFDPTPITWGWQLRVVGSGEFATQTWYPQGDCIGYVDEDDLYLLPDPAYNAAAKVAQESGDGITVRTKTLSKRLHELGLLASVEKDSLTVKVSAAGRRQRVWHVRKSCLIGE